MNVGQSNEVENSQEAVVRWESANNEHIVVEDALEEQVKTQKERARQLNPLRIACKTYTSTNSANNPNLEGRDNGLNAWLDLQLNADEIDVEMKCDARYAKNNSDTDRCYDIDHIPIRGPPKIDELDSDFLVEEVAAMASNLMNDDNVSICRETGMMRLKSAARSKKEVSSVINRPQRMEPRHHSNYIRSYSGERQRYDNINMEWDSESEIENLANKSRNKQTRNDVHTCRPPMKHEQARDTECDTEWRVDRYTERSRNVVRGQCRHSRREAYDHGRSYNRREEERRYDHNRGRCIEYDTSSYSQSPWGSRRRSGINAKPTSNVRE